jgi:hypothetical protein
MILERLMKEVNTGSIGIFAQEAPGALAQFGPTGKEALLTYYQALQGKDSGGRIQYVYPALGRLKDEQPTMILRKALSGTNKNSDGMMASIIEGLGETKNTECLRDIVVMMTAQNLEPQTRTTLVSALAKLIGVHTPDGFAPGLILAPDSIKTLIDAVPRASEHEVRALAEILARTKDPRAIPVLQKESRVYAYSEGTRPTLRKAISELQRGQPHDAKPKARDSGRFATPSDTGKPARSLRSILPIAGEPLVTSSSIGLLMDRMKAAVESDELRAWFSSMEKATEQDIPFKAASRQEVAIGLILPLDETSSVKDTVSLIRFLGERMTVLFNKNKFKPAESKKLLKRLNSLKPENVKAWESAFHKTLDKNVSKVFVVGILLPVDGLYESDTYSSVRAEHYLKRLGQISKEDVQLWKYEVDQFGGTELDAAMNIALLEAVFEKEKFQRAKFKELVAASKKQ